MYYSYSTFLLVCLNKNIQFHIYVRSTYNFQMTYRFKMKESFNIIIPEKYRSDSLKKFKRHIFGITHCYGIIVTSIYSSSDFTLFSHEYIFTHQTPVVCVQKKMVQQRPLCLQQKMCYKTSGQDIYLVLLKFRNTSRESLGSQLKISSADACEQQNQMDEWMKQKL